MTVLPLGCGYAIRRIDYRGDAFVLTPTVYERRDALKSHPVLRLVPVRLDDSPRRPTDALVHPRLFSVLTLTGLLRVAVSGPTVRPGPWDCCGGRASLPTRRFLSVPSNMANNPDAHVLCALLPVCRCCRTCAFCLLLSVPHLPRSGARRRFADRGSVRCPACTAPVRTARFNAP